MRKVIAFEGLFSYGAGFVRNGLLRPTEIPADIYAWTANPKGVKNALIIGHSFGAMAAFRMAARSPGCALIIIDGRTLLDPFSWFAFADPKVPVFNYFQRGLLPGKQVHGASVNQLILGVPHALLPGHHMVRAKALELYRG